MYRITVPAAFFDDHRKRGCVENLSGLEEKRTGNRVQVSLGHDDMLDLFSDARHYAQSGVSVYGRDMVGVVSSARATVAAMIRQIPNVEDMHRASVEAWRAEVRARLQLKRQ